MQFIRYESCKSVEGVQGELNRLVTERFISQEQADAVDLQSIVTFFNTDVGLKAANATILREFKFTVLQDASEYFDDITEDNVLLQGVVDLAILEDDGITVVDFKTDRVTGDTIQVVAENYFPQVRAYCKALEQIYDKPVKKSLLYFFRTGEFIQVK
jgi:ATP-dependent helicase/nuclease subunit A